MLLVIFNDQLKEKASERTFDTCSIDHLFIDLGITAKTARLKQEGCDVIGLGAGEPVFNSPSNPTGMIYKGDELLDIGRFCVEHKIWIVSDEIYNKLIYDGAQSISIAELSPEFKDQTLVLMDFQNPMPCQGGGLGLPLGRLTLLRLWHIASQSTPNPTSIAQYGALAADRGPNTCVEEMRQAFEARLHYAFERRINIPGLTCIKPKGAFDLFPNAKKAAHMTGFGSVDEWVEALLF